MGPIATTRERGSEEIFDGSGEELVGGGGGGRRGRRRRRKKEMERG